MPCGPVIGLDEEPNRVLELPVAGTYMQAPMRAIFVVREASAGGQGQGGDRGEVDREAPGVFEVGGVFQREPVGGPGEESSEGLEFGLENGLRWTAELKQENEPRSGIEKESNPFLHRQPSLCRLDELLRISMND